jgi:acetyltransferase-like isoleucine patch superfamily enzyme
LISKYAVVKTEKIGNEVLIGEFSVIEEDVFIGNNVIIHPNVVISAGVIIKDGVEIFPGALIGKEPKGAGSLARTPVFERKVLIGANSSIGPNAVIFYDVEIGEQTLIGDGASIREQCRIGSNCIISRYVTINYNTIVGDRTKIMDLTHITGNCIIGNDVFISINVGTVNDNNIGKEGYSERVLGPVIEDGAAIGAGATLLPRVVIGKNSIVGANSLVTKNVKENSLVMGSPAKPIRRINN